MILFELNKTEIIFLNCHIRKYEKPNDKVTQIISSLFINIICRLLTLFSTNLRDRNINIAFKNSYKSIILSIKANGTYYWWHGRAILLFHSLSMPLFLFFHSLSLRYEIIDLRKKEMLRINVTQYYFFSFFC